MHIFVRILVLPLVEALPGVQLIATQLPVGSERARPEKEEAQR